MQIKFNRPFLIVLLSLGTILSSLVFVSCEDYKYENEEPGFLGESIYDFLQEDGSFKYFLRLIDDLEYTETLSRTGSRTLFPVRDEAFERFLANNSYGVSSYEELSPAQKRSIMNISMLNNAYLSYMLANSSTDDGLGEGMALRHKTTYTYLDSISFIRNEELFENDYWKRFAGKGLYLVDNENDPTLVHFTYRYMTVQGITADDFYSMFGREFDRNDIFVNEKKVIERDIVCKNGYVHILEDLLLPPQNISQVIQSNGQTNLFNKLMNKFSAPYYNQNITNEVNLFYNGSTSERPTLSGADSVFVKRYFLEGMSDPNGNEINKSYGFLYFDPSNNDYNYQQDMGTMFVPTDAAMNEYFYGDKGRFLSESFSSWDDVPTNILALFIKNHQKKSFVNSVPHTWPTLQDENSFDMDISEANIERTYVAGNGAVYVTNKVFPPIDYQCVYGPTLLSENTKIANWAIQDTELLFYLYLQSMENMYNLIIPTDEAFQNYRDPVSWAQGMNTRKIWSFRYIEETDEVYADIYNVDENGNKTGNPVEEKDQTIIKNRLNDIIDMHIVVGQRSGDILSGYINHGDTPYPITKSFATIKVEGTGDNVRMNGGGDIELGIEPAKVVVNNVSGKPGVYNSDNGRTFYIDHILHDPVKSVYNVLDEHDEYTYFFNLLRGDERVFTFFTRDTDIQEIFSPKIVSITQGIGYVVNFYGNFHYTVFVPTEDALKQAFEEDPNLFTWDEINAIDGSTDEGYAIKKERTLYLLNFLKYHFMDNSVYLTSQSFGNLQYETAARNEYNRFRKLKLNNNGDNLQIETESGDVAKVIKTDGLYNVMGRDYIIGVTNTIGNASIISSSRSVIHLVDKALRFE